MVNNALNPVYRKEITRLEILDNVESLDQIVLPKNSLLNGKTLSEIKTIYHGYLKSEEPNGYVSSFGYPKSLLGFGKMLPSVIFTTQKPCDACGGSIFVRKVSGRQDYNIVKNGMNSIPYSSANKFKCTNPKCNASYQYEGKWSDISHSFDCPCRVCAWEDVVDNGVVIPTCAVDIGTNLLNSDDLLTLRSCVSLSSMSDISSLTKLAHVFFNALINLYEVVEIGISSNRSQFNPTIWLDEMCYYSDGVSLNNTLPEHQEGALTKTNLSGAIVIVRSFITEALPDDRDIIMFISRYCYDLISFDKKWVGFKNYNSEKARKKYLPKISDLISDISIKDFQNSTFYAKHDVLLDSYFYPKLVSGSSEEPTLEIDDIKAQLQDLLNKIDLLPHSEVSQQLLLLSGKTAELPQASDTHS